VSSVDNSVIRNIVRCRDLANFRKDHRVAYAEGPTLVFDLLRNGAKPHILALGPDFMLKGSDQQSQKTRRRLGIIERAQRADVAMAQLEEGKDIDEIEGSQHHQYDDEQNLEGLKKVAETYKIDKGTLLSVDKNVLRKISSTETSMGVVGVFSLTDKYQFMMKSVPGTNMTRPDSVLKDLRWILAINEIQDPGNMGTLIRTASALGWEGIFVVAGSCDPLNPKSVRAARGAMIHTPVQVGTMGDLRKLCTDGRLTTIVADPRGAPLSELKSKEEPPRGYVLIVNNEAKGDSRGLLPRESLRVAVPMLNDKVESLNVAVAGGILMSYLKGLAISIP